MPVISTLETLGIEAGLVWAIRLGLPKVTIPADSLRSPDLESAISALSHLLEEADALHALLGRATNGVGHIKVVRHA